MASENRLVLHSALAGNMAIAVTKFIAAAITGSSSMLTEGFHSVVDTGNQVLMLHGIRRASKPPDDLHPLGHGREIYFWSFVVALLVFAVGAGVSIYEGVVHILHPEPVKSALVSYIVLGLAFLFEGITLFIAFREFRKQKGSRGWWQTLRDSKDPSTFVVLLEDSAALIGIVIAAIFIGLSIMLQQPILDGVGSVLIGLVLAAVAIILARESMALLIGESASPETARAIEALMGAREGIERVLAVTTIQLSPHQIMVLANADFADGLDSGEVERVTGEIEKEVRERHPEVMWFFLRPKTARTEQGSGLN